MKLCEIGTLVSLNEVGGYEEEEVGKEIKQELKMCQKEQEAKQRKQKKNEKEKKRIDWKHARRYDLFCQYGHILQYPVYLMKRKVNEIVLSNSSNESALDELDNELKGMYS